MHQVGLYLQSPHFLRLLHPDHHVVQNVERIFDCLQGLEDVPVLFPEQVEGILGVVFVLEVID